MSNLNLWRVLVVILLSSSICRTVLAEEKADDSNTPPPAQWTPVKKAAVDWIDLNAAMLKEINRTIWEYAEPGMLEYRSAALITPTVGLSVATFVAGSPGHNWAEVACSRSSIGEKGMLVATKVLAATALDILQQGETLAAMRAEFDEMTEGKAYQSSIPADVPPPVLPNPYQNPDWTPGDSDYPTWGSFVWEELPAEDNQSPR